MNCSAPSSLTRAEALARLAAVPALPRGERMSEWPGATAAWGREIGRQDEVPRLWWRWWAMQSSLPGFTGNIRRFAQPLRRAREERESARYGGGYADRNVGAALLEFFEDLSILVRTTPAPCPWCGGEDCDDDVQCLDCNAFGPGTETGATEPASIAERITNWNKVAIPMAFRRLAQGGV